jgi:uncharacterized phage protein gp47/JayE
MAFLKKNQQDIYEALVADLRKRMPELTDFESGSVIRSMLETIAFEQAVFYEQLDYVYNAPFVNTATGLNLEKVVAILDVTRNEPDFALGKVVFWKEEKFTEDIIIPIGTQIITKDNPDQTPVRKSYFTIEEGVISGAQTSVEVKVQADTRGREMEAGKDELVILPRPVKGIVKVTNEDPIKFAGRNRETDEELRLRAKKALLAAGRASETSIEQALLAMPNILDVKVKENGPGAIKVYVDGLQESNSKALSEKLNEVRAAGIYAQLAPADIRNVTAVFKITPHDDVIAAEIPDLEANVAKAVSDFTLSGKMGMPFSIAQMTSAILGVKGVKDIERFEIIFAPAEPVEVNTDGIQNPEKEPVKELAGYKKDGTPVYKIPADTRNIVFSDVGRFTPQSLRIAAGQKKLPMQFQVKLIYPNAQSALAINTKIRDVIKSNVIAGSDLVPADLNISQDIITKYLALVTAYYQKLSEELLTQINGIRVDPLGDKVAKLLSWLKNEKHPELSDPDALSAISYFSSDEAAFRQKVFELITADDPKMNAIVKAVIKDLITAFAEQKLQNFSDTSVAADFLSDVTMDLKQQLVVLKKDLTELNQKIANLQMIIISGKLTESELTAKKTELAGYQKTVVDKQVLQDNILNKLSSLTDILRSLLNKWSSLVKSKLLDLTQDSQLNKFVNSISKISDFDLSLRLRSFTFENVEYFRTPVPVSFIEKPVFDFLWVYSKDLRIAGTLKLTLPLTLNAIVKNTVFSNVRSAINLVLFNQLPEQDIQISHLIDAAMKQEHVIAAVFEKGSPGLVEDQYETLQLIPDRVTDKVVIVKPSERVLLSDKFFKITD